jgi:hypothetical protein
MPYILMYGKFLKGFRAVPTSADILCRGTLWGKIPQPKLIRLFALCTESFAIFYETLTKRSLGGASPTISRARVPQGGVTLGPEQGEPAADFTVLGSIIIMMTNCAEKNGTEMM